jgi:hypothetical protein
MGRERRRVAVDAHEDGLDARVAGISPWGGVCQVEALARSRTERMLPDRAVLRPAVRRGRWLALGIVLAATPAAGVTLDEAARILTTQVLQSSHLQVDARLVSAPLKKGSLVRADRKGDHRRFRVHAPAFFAFVDDSPCAAFEHAVRYVFIDAATGTVRVERESWWPRVNGRSIYVLRTTRATDGGVLAAGDADAAVDACRSPGTASSVRRRSAAWSTGRAPCRDLEPRRRPQGGHGTALTTDSWSAVI